MSTDAMKERVRETSPQVYARIGGVLYLILVLALMGELSLCLWLMVKGVNVPKWNERARLALG